MGLGLSNRPQSNLSPQNKTHLLTMEFGRRILTPPTIITPIRKHLHALPRSQGRSLASPQTGRSCVPFPPCGHALQRHLRTSGMGAGPSADGRCTYSVSWIRWNLSKSRFSPDEILGVEQHQDEQSRIGTIPRRTLSKRLTPMPGSAPIDTCKDLMPRNTGESGEWGKKPRGAGVVKPGHYWITCRIQARGGYITFKARFARSLGKVDTYSHCGA